MAMKQTQTKVFDFSDIGLDFCAGSKNLFPDRFKKMLALGYNTQTVSSVTVAGNQVVLTYGVSHGYVADRVLKLNASNLNDEYVIDSVTSNTVTMTIDNAPSSVSGGFTTFIAPLGWQLVYEQANIHVYKMKHIDNTDRFMRLCFQGNVNYRNRIAPCVGRSFDLATGFITDSTSLSDTKSITAPNLYAWEFSYNAEATYNDYNYAQGVSIFGKGVVIGSKYHFCICHKSDGGGWRLSGVLASQALNYEALNHPILICEKVGSPTSSNVYPQSYLGKFMLGNIICVAKSGSYNEITNNMDTYPQAYNSFLPTSIDSFNTTTAEPLALYIEQNGQLAGFAVGVYKCKYASANTPIISNSNTPSKTSDIDLNSTVYVQPITSSDSNAAYATFYAMPVEEIASGS